MGFLDWILGHSTPESTSPDSVKTDGGGATSSSEQNGAVAVAVAEQADVAQSTPNPAETWWSQDGATLTDVAIPNRPDLTPDARALENLLISHFDGHNLTLPTLIPAAEKILPLISTSDFSMKHVAEALGEDQVVAAAVLRMANSPLYRGNNKIGALQPAIGRLGIRALRMLLMHESMRVATFHSRGGLKEIAQGVWRRSLSSACIMRGLAEFTGIDKENAFLIGLLHDIGYVVVLRITNEYCKTARFGLDVDYDTFEYLCHESHQEFGELVADAWSMPQDLKEVLINHHDYPSADDPHRIIRLQLQLTDMINALLGFSSFAPYNLLQSRPVLDLDLSHKAKFVVYLEQLPDEVDELVNAL